MGNIIIIGIVLTVFAGLGIGGYFLYHKVKGITDDDDDDKTYCEKTYPQRRRLNDKDKTLPVYLYTDCNVSQCAEPKSKMEKIIEHLRLNDTSSQSSIDNQCTQFCAAFNTTVDCACTACGTCHEGCGLSEQERCHMYLKCGIYQEGWKKENETD